MAVDVILRVLMSSWHWAVMSSCSVLRVSLSKQTQLMRTAISSKRSLAWVALADLNSLKLEEGLQ